MCIIIINQNAKNIPEHILHNASQQNPHGLGVVWLDTYEVTKHESKNYSILQSDRPFIAHFRYATVGDISFDNIHPFVCGKNEDELLMMNGSVFNVKTSKGQTDTEAIANQLGNIKRSKWKKYLSRYNHRFVTVN